MEVIDLSRIKTKDNKNIIWQIIGDGSEFTSWDEVDGIKLTKIDQYAFYNKDNLHHIIIPYIADFSDDPQNDNRELKYSF